MSNALTLALPDFYKPFKIECDACEHGIGALLMQERWPIAYFGGKLNGAIVNYQIYSNEMCASVRLVGGLQGGRVHWDISTPHQV